MDADSDMSDLHVDQDEQIGDDDSAMGDDHYTYGTQGRGSHQVPDSYARRITTSLASSVKDFKHENGRRYHAFEDDAYFLPNDVRLVWRGAVFAIANAQTRR